MKTGNGGQHDEINEGLPGEKECPFQESVLRKGEVTLDTKTGRRLLFICGADVPLPESPRHGDRWGDWEYNAKWLTLTWQPKGRAYEIDLEQCNNSAQVLDWVAQITHMTWATSEVVGTLVQALDDLLNLQGSVNRALGLH